MKLSLIARNAEADTWAALVDAGSIKFYDGTIPADPQTAITTQNLLCSVPYGSPAYPEAANGALILATSIFGVNVLTGTTTWARIFKADGTTVVIDATVGLVFSDADIEVVNVDLAIDEAIEVQTANYTRPES